MIASLFTPYASFFEALTHAALTSKEMGLLTSSMTHTTHAQRPQHRDRVLFMVPPLTGHINPTVAVGQALLSRGVEVWWVGHQSALSRSLPQSLMEGAHVWPLDEELNEAQLGRLHEGREARGVEAFQFLWEGVLLPLAEGTLKGCVEAIEALKPQLCVVDQQNLAGALACELTGTPWLTSSTTSVGVVNALEGLPQAEAWLQARLDESLTRLGLNNLTGRSLSELTLSQRGVLVFSSERLSASLQPAGAFPEHYHFVGPALKGVRAAIEFPWSRLIEGRPKVFMSLGTINAERGARLYREALEAFSDDAYQLCLVAPPELLPPESAWPDHLITAPRLPQLELLAHMHVVITHAGHNTTCESLAHGLPLLALPIKDDQPLVAEQVKRVGAGLRLPFGRVKAAKLRAAVDQLTREPSFKEAARVVQREFQALGDGGEGAALLTLAELERLR